MPHLPPTTAAAVTGSILSATAAERLCPATPEALSPSEDLRASIDPAARFATIMADPPWQFDNRTGKVAPEHTRLRRYPTLPLDVIRSLPIKDFAAPTAHLYLWVPNALLPEGLQVMDAWGFTYKTNIIWHKIRQDGGSDGRGVGFYFRNVTEILLFGTRGKKARTLDPGRRQVNCIRARKREHSRKPDEQYDLIESCSPGPFLEVFARGARPNWTVWGNQATEAHGPTPASPTSLPHVAPAGCAPPSRPSAT